MSIVRRRQSADKHKGLQRSKTFFEIIRTGRCAQKWNTPYPLFCMDLLRCRCSAKRGSGVADAESVSKMFCLFGSERW